MSELKATISNLQSQLKQEQSRSNDTEMYYQEKIQEMKHEVERERYQNEEKTRMTCTDYEMVIRDLKRQIQDKNEDMERTK